MLSILPWVLVLIVLCSAGYRLYRSIRGLRFLTSEASRFERSTLGSEGTEGDGHLFVLLPCLNEQAHVDATLAHFSRLAKEVPGRVLLVPITGESEDELKRVRREGIPAIADAWWRGLTRPTFLKLNGGRFPLSAFEDILRLRTFAKDSTSFRDELLRNYDAAPSTATVIDKWLAEHPEEARAIVRLHEPARRGTKATKLNYAATVLPQRYPEHFTETSVTYFGVYDFDARPHPRSFEYLVAKLRELREKGEALPTAFQQVPLPLGSELEQLPSLSPSLVAAAWRVESALSSDAFGVYRGQRRPASKPAKRGLARLAAPRAFRGSGLFVQAEELRELGGFPVDSEDIALGYRLDFVSRARFPHPYPVWVQPTPSTPQLVRQTRRGFHGIFSGKRELDWARRRAPSQGVHGGGKRLLLRYAQDFQPILHLLAGLLASVLFAAGGKWLEAGVVFVGLWLLTALLLWWQVSLGTRLVERFDRRAPRRWSLATMLVAAPLGPLFTLMMLGGYGLWKWRSGGQLSEETAST